MLCQDRGHRQAARTCSHTTQARRLPCQEQRPKPSNGGQPFRRGASRTRKKEGQVTPAANCQKDTAWECSGKRTRSAVLKHSTPQSSKLFSERVNPAALRCQAAASLFGR